MLTYTIPVHSFQVDFGGVVSNTVYVQWMEIGRGELMQAAGMPMRGVWDSGWTPVVVHTSIDYKRPFKLDDTVYAELWLSELTPLKARIEHRFRDADGALCTTGEQVVVFVGREALRPIRLSESLLAPFRAFVQRD